jgi:ribosomal protein S6
MQKYELTLVLSKKTTPAKKKSVEKDLEKLIGILKGQIVKSEDWGEIEFSNSFCKEISGVFMHFLLELEKSVAKNLEDKIRVDDTIMRHLLVRKED